MVELWKSDYKRMCLATHNNPYKSRDGDSEVYFYVVNISDTEIKVGVGDYRRVNRYRFINNVDGLLHLVTGPRNLLEFIELSIMQEFFISEYDGKRLSHTGHTEVVPSLALDKCQFLIKEFLYENKIKETNISAFDESVRLGSAIKSELCIS